MKNTSVFAQAMTTGMFELMDAVGGTGQDFHDHITYAGEQAQKAIANNGNAIEMALGLDLYIMISKVKDHMS